jgi:hypothetical protein
MSGGATTQRATAIEGRISLLEEPFSPVCLEPSPMFHHEDDLLLQVNTFYIQYIGFFSKAHRFMAPLDLIFNIRVFALRVRPIARTITGCRCNSRARNLL